MSRIFTCFTGPVKSWGDSVQLAKLKDFELKIVEEPCPNMTEVLFEGFLVLQNLVENFSPAGFGGFLPVFGLPAGSSLWQPGTFSPDWLENLGVYFGRGFRTTIKQWWWFGPH